MDLQQMKLDSEIYKNSIQKTINIIDGYIDLYKEYDSLYTQKWNEWINNIRKEFITIYSDLDFILENKENAYNLKYEISKTIYEVATFNTLEFELMIGCSDQMYTSLRFLQTKPNSSKINISIEPNIKKYLNNIELNKSRDGVTISQYSFSKSIDPLIKVKNYIQELNFKIENVEEAYTILQNKLSELHSKFNELKSNNIIGMVEIDKDKISVESLSKLIELL
ncbi:MAG: hypothetical protein ACRCXT_10585 [Paraclostridium sp.]